MSLKSASFKLGKYYISRIAGVLMSKPGKVPTISPQYFIVFLQLISSPPIQSIQYDHLISIHHLYELHLNKDIHFTVHRDYYSLRVGMT